MKPQTVKILGVEVRHLRPPARKPEPVALPAGKPKPVHTAGAPHPKYREGMEYLEELLNEVCFDAEISVGQVVRGGNARPLVAVRRRFARLAMRAGYSSVMIASILRRHHTSVLSLLKGR